MYTHRSLAAMFLAQKEGFVMERATGIEPVANSLSPVESVGLTLLEDRIWVQKRRILRPSCAQIYPSPKILGDATRPKKLCPRARSSAAPSAKQISVLAESSKRALLNLSASLIRRSTKSTLRPRHQQIDVIFLTVQTNRKNHLHRSAPTSESRGNSFLCTDTFGKC